MHFRQKFRASFVSAPQVSCKAAAFLRNCTSIINAPGGKSLHSYVCMYLCELAEKSVESGEQ